MTLKKHIEKAAILGLKSYNGGPLIRNELEKQKLDKLPAAQALLQLQALESIKSRSGFQTVAAEASALPEESDSETLNYISSKSRKLLTWIMGQEYKALLPEFIGLAIRHRRILPPEHLPQLLEIAHHQQRKGKLDQNILQCGGNRMRWLAQLNPDWQQLYAPEKVEMAQWENGSMEQRKVLLKKLLQHSPKEAKTLLLESWEGESSANQIEFLEILAASHLSTEDLPLLEKACHSRRKDLRQLGVKLKAKLGEAGLVAALKKFLDDSIHIKKGFLQSSLEIELPDDYDQAWKEIGIEEKDSLVVGGKKTNWVAKAVSLVPPSHWERESKLSPEKFIQLVRKSDWHTAFIQGLYHSAILHGDQDWIRQVFLAIHKISDSQQDLLQFGYSFNKKSEKPRTGYLDNRFSPLILCREMDLSSWSYCLEKVIRQLNNDDYLGLDALLILNHLHPPNKDQTQKILNEFRLHTQHSLSSPFAWQHYQLWGSLFQLWQTGLAPENEDLFKEKWIQEMAASRNLQGNVQELQAALYLRKQIHQSFL